jgi:hypothetical protein
MPDSFLNFMEVLLVLTTLLLAASLAAPPQAPLPPQAPPVKAQPCPCGCVGDCTCGACPAKDYPAGYAAAAAGARVTLAVGCDAKADYATAKLPGYAPGVYVLSWNAAKNAVWIDPLVVPQRMAPAQQFVRQCVNGVCRLVPVEAAK